MALIEVSKSTMSWSLLPIDDMGLHLCLKTRFLQNATEESYRNKAIQACLPSCNSAQYFLQISLKSSGFFLLEKKYQETCVCENRIHKIQTSTGLYKSISVCLMIKKIFQIILSSVKF